MTLVVRYKDGIAHYYGHRHAKGTIGKDYSFTGDAYPVYVYRPGVYKIFGLEKGDGGIRTHQITVYATSNGYAVTGDIQNFSVSVQ